MEQSNLIWAFDQGANSIGWTVYDPDYLYFKDTGVRRFKAGVEKLGQGDREISPNAKKSEHRGRMRSRRRKQKRLKELIKFLQKIDLMPKEITHEYFNSLDPYKIRNDALERNIEKHEFGRAIYHIAKRRGFKSNASSRANEKKEKGVMHKGKDGKSGIDEILDFMILNDYKTIGKALYNLNPHEIRRRNRYTTRKLYEEEFEELWKCQKQYHPNIYNDENYKSLKRILFNQLPLKSQKGRKGKCTFEKGKPRVPKAHPQFQEFRLLQQLNSLLVMTEDRLSPEKQKLTKDEFDKLTKYLNENRDLKIDKELISFKEILGFKKDKVVRINFDANTKIQGLSTNIELKKALKVEYLNLTSSQIDNIFHTLLFKNDNNWFIEYAQKKWNLSEEGSKRLSKVKLEDKYGNLSLKAIKKIFPFLREGEKYHEACEKAGYEHFNPKGKIELKDQLPLPPKIANPVVTVALFELRKICNMLLEKYGRPKVIKFENASELKASKKERQKIKNMQEDRRDDNERIYKRLSEYEVFRESKTKKNYILKYKLWEEANEICPYTGRSISVDDLFSEKIQIEHIIPHSISRDNSYMNKTISFEDENRRKGNKTPYEYYGDTEQYQEILERIKNFPRSKAAKFTFKGKYDSLEKIRDEWVSTYLNDTRYISRETQKYLQHICGNVIPIKGGVTSKLRKMWGLNSILNETLPENHPLRNAKNRDDHRHHAVDAIVVAMTDYHHLKELSLTEEREIERNLGEMKKEIKFPRPWANFRNEVRDSISNIIVSQKVNKRKRGTLFADTYYGQRKYPNGEYRVSDEGFKILSVRKKLSDLTKTTVHKITDESIQEIVYSKIEELGYSRENVTDIQVKKSLKDPIYLPNNKNGKDIQINKVRIDFNSDTAKQIDENKWIIPNNNYCLIIYKDLANDEILKKHFYMFDAVKIKGNVVKEFKKSLNKNYEFITSVFNNDFFIKGEIAKNFNINDKSTYHLVTSQIYFVKTWQANTGQVKLKLHFSNREKKDETSFTPSKANNFKKIEIDALGYISFAE